MGEVHRIDRAAVVQQLDTRPLPGRQAHAVERVGVLEEMEDAQGTLGIVQSTRRPSSRCVLERVLVHGELDQGSLCGREALHESQLAGPQHAVRAVLGFEAVVAAPDVVPERRLQQQVGVGRGPLQQLGEPPGVDVHALRVAHTVQLREVEEPLGRDLGGLLLQEPDLVGRARRPHPHSPPSGRTGR